MAEAKAANHMKDEFLAMLSHELRTPLNAIVGWVSILSSGRVGPEDFQTGLEVIGRNAKAQAQLVDDLLDVSRIISKNFRLDVRRVSLMEIIEAAIAAVMPAAEARGVLITKVLDSLTGPVSGDPVRLQQVIWNLLSNAVKFTPEGGRVQVLLERVNSHAEITVVDTGIGISPEFLPHVFDRFRQADSSTTRRQRAGARPDNRQGTDRATGRLKCGGQEPRRGSGGDLRRDTAHHGGAWGHAGSGPPQTTHAGRIPAYRRFAFGHPGAGGG